MAECPSVCEHLHLPVQSGADRVLHRMGRQYTVEAYRELVARLRAAVPGISLTTDVIVGFCGETEAQFEATLDLLREVRFDQVFAAAFSPRPGTPAARLPDDVPAAEKRRRLNALLELQEGIGHEREPSRGSGGRPRSCSRRPDRPESHEHEGPEATPVEPTETRLVGRNREHRLVHADGPAELVGRFASVVIDRAGPYSLGGRLAV